MGGEKGGEIFYIWGGGVGGSLFKGGETSVGGGGGGDSQYLSVSLALLVC